MPSIPRMSFPIWRILRHHTPCGGLLRSSRSCAVSQLPAPSSQSRINLPLRRQRQARGRQGSVCDTIPAGAPPVRSTMPPHAASHACVVGTLGQR
jgi:hypothetical protein